MDTKPLLKDPLLKMLPILKKQLNVIIMNCFMIALSQTPANSRKPPVFAIASLSK